MDSSAGSLIRAANQVLIVDGDLDAVGRFFTPGYVAHLTDSDLTGGHEAIRGFVGAQIAVRWDDRLQCRNIGKPRTLESLARYVPAS